MDTSTTKYDSFNCKTVVPSTDNIISDINSAIGGNNVKSVLCTDTMVLPVGIKTKFEVL